MATQTHDANSQMIKSLAIIGGLFFIMGFFTWLNGPLLTFVRLAFDLDDVNAFLILMVFYLSYFMLALPASWILGRTGLKKGISLGLVLMAVGAAVFGQFATHRFYPGALGGLFILGGGLALLQTAINPYVSILGPIESGAQRIAVMGICNKTAGILAPLLIGSLVLHGVGDLAARVQIAGGAERERLLDAFAANIYAPYLIMAGILLLIAIGALRSPLPELDPSLVNPAPEASAESPDEARSIFHVPHLWLGVLCLFVYMGAEVMAGDAIVTYGSGFDLPLDETKFFTSFTLGAMLVGYLCGLALTPRFFSQQAYLGLSALLGLAFVIAAFFTRGYVSVGFVAMLGFANAMMWPAIFPLAIRGLGSLTETGSALLIMGIAGGAIIPQAFAVMKQYYGFQAVFALLMAPCYLYIFYFACRGYRVGLGTVATLAASPEPKSPAPVPVEEAH